VLRHLLAKDWLLLALLSIPLCAVSFTVQYGITRMPANRVVVLFLSELVVAAVASYFLADEAMRLRDWIGASLEHWDGAGYPDGLRGERIPLPGKDGDELAGEGSESAKTPTEAGKLLAKFAEEYALKEKIPLADARRAVVKQHPDLDALRRGRAR